MADKNEIVTEIRIQLKNIEELFAEPTADPFSPDARFHSGVDELLASRQGERVPESWRVIIALPATAVTADLVSKTGAALNQYCAFHIAVGERELAENRFMGQRYLLTSGLTALLLAAAALVVLWLPTLPDILKGILALWISTGVWVAAWEPAYMVLYAWRPIRRQMHLYRSLQHADLVIESI